MTLQNIAQLVLALAVIALLIARQLRWRTFDAGRILRLPLVVGAIGVLTLANGRGTALTATDLTLLLIELALSVAIGAGMGRLAVFRVDPAGSGALQTRTGWAGASLWFVLVGIRIAFDAVGHALGTELLTQSGVILVMLAATRATSALVTRSREPHAGALSA